jgi:hypothetical protein
MHFWFSVYYELHVRALFAHHQEALHIPIVVYAVPPDDEQIVLETCR